MWRPGTLEDKFMQHIFKTIDIVEPPSSRDILVFHTKGVRHPDIQTYDHNWKLTGKELRSSILSA